MSGVGMIINTTEECSCRITTNVLDKEMTATRMLIEEVRNIVNEAGNHNKRAFDGLLLDYTHSSELQLPTMNK